MPLLGAGAEAMIWVNVIVIALGFLIHSRIESGWGWIGRHLVQSPLHPRLHHKLDMSEPTGFFSMMPVWDHLFGGWSGARDANVAIGKSEHGARLQGAGKRTGEPKGGRVATFGKSLFAPMRALWERCPHKPLKDQNSGSPCAPTNIISNLAMATEDRFSFG